MHNRLWLILACAVVSSACATAYAPPDGSRAVLTISTESDQVGTHLGGSPARASSFWVQLFDFGQECPSTAVLGTVSSGYLGDAEIAQKGGSTTVAIPTGGHFFFRAYWQANTFPTITTCLVSAGFVPLEGQAYNLYLTADGDYCRSDLRSDSDGAPIDQFDARGCQARLRGQSGTADQIDLP